MTENDKQIQDEKEKIIQLIQKIATKRVKMLSLKFQLKYT